MAEEKQTKTLYELTYLISPDKAEAELEVFIKGIENVIAEIQAEKVLSEAPRRTRLSYSIKQKGEAYLAVVSFLADPGHIAELKQKLEKELSILRYLLIKKEVKKLDKVKKDKPKKPKLADLDFEEGGEEKGEEDEEDSKKEKKQKKEKKEKAEAKPKKEKATKAELDAIEKDLDEILGE